MTAFPQVDVVGVGLNATDTLILLPAYPERGSKIGYSMAHVMPGGQVAVVARHESVYGARAFD